MKIKTTKKSAIIRFAILTLAVGFYSLNAFAAETKMTKNSATEMIKIKKEEKSLTPLFKGGFKVVGIGLAKGQKLEKHETPTSAFLYVQSGSVLFLIGDKKVSLLATEYLEIPVKEMHEVQALEDSKLLLIK